jgi:type I restriction enzyme S subunit
VSFTESLEDIVLQNPNGLLSAHSTWARVPLGLVFDVQNGFPFESKYFNASGDGMPLIRIRDVVRGSTETHYSGEYEPAFVVNPGDIVIGMDGDFNCRVWQGSPALLNQRVCRLIPHSAWYSKGLLAQVIQGYLDAVNGKTSAITVKHLSSQTIKEIPLPLPPAKEQRRILEAVDSYLTRLDDAVGSLDRAQAKLKAYRASVLKAAVEGRLVPTQAVLARAEKRAYESAKVLLAQILKERRRRWEDTEVAKLKANGKIPKNDKWKAKYDEPAAPDTSKLPKLPEGWCWARSEQVSEFVTKGTTPNMDQMTAGVGEVPYIKVYNMTFDGTLDFETDPTFIPKSVHHGSLARSLCRPGDVLMNIVGPPLGKVSIVPSTHEEWNINQAVARYRPVGLNMRYFAYVLLGDQAMRWASQRAKATAGQFNLTLEIARDIPIPIPPKDEQERIVDEVDRMLSVASATLQVVAGDKDRCGRLRQSVLKWAFEGKLVNQDPTDEPAQKLLAQIRAERTSATLNNNSRARADQRTL